MGGSYYTEFDYVLPDEFIKAGNPKVTSYTAWYDTNNIKGMQFTFSNGQSEITSPIFGNKSPSGTGIYKNLTVMLHEAVESVQTLMLN